MWVKGAMGSQTSPLMRVGQLYSTQRAAIDQPPVRVLHRLGQAGGAAAEEQRGDIRRAPRRGGRAAPRAPPPAPPPSTSPPEADHLGDAERAGERRAPAPGWPGAQTTARGDASRSSGSSCGAG